MPISTSRDSPLAARLQPAAGAGTHRLPKLAPVPNGGVQMAALACHALELFRKVAEDQLTILGHQDQAQKPLGNPRGRSSHVRSTCYRR